MKNLFIVAVGVVACAGLTACGGVDRNGTRDNIVKSYSDFGDTVDADCVDEVLGGYTDDQLKAIDRAFNDQQSTSETDAIRQQLDACRTVAG